MTAMMRDLRSQELLAARAAPKLRGQTVTISGVSKRYGAVRAVEDVSIEVGAGEFLSLLGPSGSGKTTLLMMIAGFESATEGSIRVGDRDLTYVPPNERGIGMVFQKYALFPHMTVAQNIAFPLKMRKLAKAEIAERVRRALSLVRLDDYDHRMPSQLSGGQQQRIAVARATVLEPPVLLMDEPLGALDKKLREHMQLEIKRIHRELGVTVLYVTHDQEEAMTMSDRICLMRNGRIEQVGTPRELYIEPASVYAADFLGESNLVVGTHCGEGEVELASRADSLRLRGKPRVDVPAGRNVRCLIRPEAIRLLGPAERADNEIAATIVDATLAGGVTRYLLGAADGLELRATVLSAGTDAQHAVGAQVRAGFERDNVRILDESTAG